MTQTTASDSFVLPVDKPAGPTSHDIVARARRALKTRRIGHTGTLDPFASGLLLLCVGNATRVAEYLTRMPKTYEAELVLGAATDTDDFTGAVAATSDGWHALDEAAVRAELGKWHGTHMQLPSQYSAKKVDGERAYVAARRGESVVTQAAEITIHDIAITEFALPRVQFTVTCSSGTYVRALARDIGVGLGTHAHLAALRRTRIGPHCVYHAVPTDRLDDAALVARAAMSALAAIAHLPRLELDDAQLREIGFGRGFAAHPDAAAGTAGEIALAHGGELVAIGYRDGGMVRPRKVFTGG